MNEHGSAALSLDDVSQRFADSERALGDARERLERLAGAQESVSASAASLREASNAVGEFARSATALIGELEQAQRQAREVLEAGAHFLDGTELRELKAAVGDLARTVDERLDQIKQRVGDVQAADNRAAELQSELDRRTAKLSTRQRKQLGLA
ncbi:DNA repair protein RecN [Candidatus Solirubrobacter pratensis]|uniref:hypothetical protein n=1 Tax=Candidatus Solirubrobacter pratensis TaxID=1298857 RepID=UPI00041F365D|nr:hypothetical protein [Candidatus Solirubrobacter pratensis]